MPSPFDARRELFGAAKKFLLETPAKAVASSTPASDDFDPPHPGLGALFPISRGMLQAASLVEDLLNTDVVAADGRPGFMQALNDFAAGARPSASTSAAA